MVLPAYDDECFFITPIGEEGSDIRKRSDGVLNFIVSKAAQELGLAAVRADNIAKPGQITLQVVEHVLNAKAVVCDLTGSNPNVFYELAVRHAARKPVALICEKGEKLPFDIGQMRTIFFDHRDLGDADMCRQGIVDQLTEGISSGAVDSPIATAVDVTALQSGSAVDRNVAELVTGVNELSRSQKDMADLLAIVLRELHTDGGSSLGRQPFSRAFLEDLAETTARSGAYLSGLASANGDDADDVGSIARRLMASNLVVRRVLHDQPLDEKRTRIYQATAAEAVRAAQEKANRRLHGIDAPKNPIDFSDPPES